MQSENHGADTRLGVNELTDIEPVIGQLKPFRFSRKNYYREGGGVRESICLRQQ